MKMPFTIDTLNAPSLLVNNESNTGFYLATIAVSGNRLYRITANDTYYYFSLDTSLLNQGDPVIVKVPFIKSKFITDSSLSFSSIPLIGAFEDIMTVQDTLGEDIVSSGFTFKLFNLIFNDAVPQLIDFNTDYTIGSNTVRFVYYRYIDSSLTFYSNAYGDKAFTDEYTSLVTIPTITSLTPLIFTQSISGILYYFVKVSDTPNIILGTTNVIVPPVVPPTNMITDSYTINQYEYTLTSVSPNIFTGGTVVFNLIIKDTTTNTFLKTIDVIDTLTFDANGLIIETIGDNPTLINTIDVQAVVNTNATFIDIRLVV